MVVVPVQSAFTAYVPVKVSSAKPPPTLRDSVPETFPDASRFALPTAAMGTGPVGRMTTPESVKPYAPALLPKWHCRACAAGAIPTKATRDNAPQIALKIVRFISVLPKFVRAESSEGVRPSQRIPRRSVPEGQYNAVQIGCASSTRANPLNGRDLAGVSRIASGIVVDSRATPRFPASEVTMHSRRIQFGAFELDSASGELRKH